MIYQQNNMMIIKNPIDLGRFWKLQQLISLGTPLADDSSHVI